MIHEFSAGISKLAQFGMILTVGTSMSALADEAESSPHLTINVADRAVGISFDGGPPAMQHTGDQLGFSPSDRIVFIEGDFATWMDRWYLELKKNRVAITTARGSA